MIESSRAAVECRHVSKRFTGTEAVRDLSFSLHGGEVLGLIGPNGAGKTTTLRMLMGILLPDEGSIRVDGAPPGPARSRAMGYLPEERGLYRKLTVMDCIAYLASLCGMSRRAVEQKALPLLKQVGLESRRDSRIESLSKGMGQLIQLIVAILHDPLIVILDEPFSGLDPVNTELLKGMVLDLKTAGKAIILSTHDMGDVEELCDSVLMMDHGQTVLNGRVAEVRARFGGRSVFLDVDGTLEGVPGVREGSQLSALYTLFPVVPLWLMSLFFLTPSSPLWVVLSIFPLTAPSMVIERSAVADIPAGQVAISLAVLAACVVAGVIVGTRVFRAYLLMYGKRPRLGEVARTVLARKEASS